MIGAKVIPVKPTAEGGGEIEFVGA
jgi:hypothetical protein